MLREKSEVVEVDKDKKYHVFQGVSVDLRYKINDMNDVIVYFDPDVDGVIAGLLVCRYLMSLGKRFKWYINSNRAHGLDSRFLAIKNKNIIAVDFIITDDEIKRMISNGNTVISMDHHENGDKFIYHVGSGWDNYGVVINNQYPFEDEDGRYLSGAGVVFETLCYLDKSFDTVENRSLVGITLLSDIRDIENSLARGYLYDLYNHKCKGFIGYLIDGTMGERDYGFGVPRLDRNYIDYKFSPAVNACLRFNQEDMVVNFFLGIGDLDLSYRDKQKELVSNIVDSIKIVDFPKVRVCYFSEDDFPEYVDVLSNFVGLAASRMLDGCRSVICYMIGTGDDGKRMVKRASFRGHINGLDYLNPLSKYIEGVGHKPAFGIKNLLPSKELFKRVNRVCDEVEDKSDHSRSIIESNNLSFFVKNKGDRIGTDNMYCLVGNRVYIKYTGNNIKRKRSGANFEEYSVDGYSVMCFDRSLSFDTAYILPIMERGFLCMYLEK